MTRFEKDLNTFMAVAHEVALAEAYETPTTPEVRRHAHALSRFAKDGLAQIRRAERAQRTDAGRERRRASVDPRDGA